MSTFYLFYFFLRQHGRTEVWEGYFNGTSFMSTLSAYIVEDMKIYISFIIIFPIQTRFKSFVIVI